MLFKVNNHRFNSKQYIFLLLSTCDFCINVDASKLPSKTVQIFKPMFIEFLLKSVMYRSLGRIRYFRQSCKF